MANGYVRVTSQYLRRIHLPAPESILDDTAEALRAAFRQRDHLAADAAVAAVMATGPQEGPVATAK